MRKALVWVLNRPRRANAVAGSVAALTAAVIGVAVYSTSDALPVNEDQACLEDAGALGRELFLSERDEGWSKRVSRHTVRDVILDPTVVPHGRALIVAATREHDLCTVTIDTSGPQFEIAMRHVEKGVWRGESWAPTGEG